MKTSLKRQVEDGCQGSWVPLSDVRRKDWSDRRSLLVQPTFFAETVVEQRAMREVNLGSQTRCQGVAISCVC